MKKSQEKQIINQLLKDGYISRNWCLQNYISRLSAIIFNLKLDGWDFDTKLVKRGNSKDYIYKVTKSPYKVATYTLENGQTIQRYVKN